jgi:chromosome segregation ATPase
MPIDGRPVREKARREYQQLLRQLETARAQIEEFEKKDRPEFGHWLSRQCGALLTEIRETEQKLRAARDLLFEIEAEALFNDCSHPRAYERVMERNRQQAEIDSRRDKAGSSTPPPGREGEFRGPFEEEPFFHSNAGTAAESVAQKKSARSSRLKELYRALVRRLHPDTQNSTTPQHVEWWHQVQMAYASGDAEQLEVLLTLCETEQKQTTTSVSLLMRMTRHLRSSLRTLQGRLRECRRDPAWRFSTREDPSALFGRIEWRLKAELAEAKQVLAALEAQLASWARQVRSARRPKRPRPNWPGAFESYF